MKIELWQSQQSEHAHEARALKRLLTDLLEGARNDFCLVCANFHCGGERIDLMVVKRHTVVVTELKDASGRLEGGENGEWPLSNSTGTSVRLNPGRRNPYQQARIGRSHFATVSTAIFRLSWMNTITCQLLRHLLFTLPEEVPGLVRNGQEDLFSCHHDGKRSVGV